MDKSQIQGAFECLKNYEQWVSRLEKSRLGVEAQFLGFSKWQKDFSSNNGQWYGVQFYFSDTPAGFANFLLIIPMEEPQPDEFDAMIDYFLN